MFFHKALIVLCLFSLCIYCSAKWVLLEDQTDSIGIITSDDHAAKKGAKKSGWSYGDLEGWIGVSKTCATTPTSRQSPINIVEENAVAAGKSIYLTPQNTYETIVNNGHTAKVALENTVMFTKNGQSNSFRVMQLHFHWGSIENGKVVGGSEHTVNGKRFAAEMHIVHANNKYPSNPVTKLLEQKDGLLVIGTFIEIGDQPNVEMQKIVDALGDIAKSGQSSSLVGLLSLRDLLPATLLQRFYHYEGSLTTPPCSETAQWILPIEHIKISMQQFEAFQKLVSDHGPIHGNFRPTQALNGRKIYYHGSC